MVGPIMNLGRATMQTIREAIGANREPTELERQAIAEVHELVDRFAMSLTDTAEIRAATSGRQRWLATRFTHPDDPRFPALMAMLDALIADDRTIVQTNKGAFAVEELWPMKIDYEGRICFPIAQPWRIEPDAKTGLGGERGEPIYRVPPVYGDPDAESVQPEWWEMNETTGVPF